MGCRFFTIAAGQAVQPKRLQALTRRDGSQQMDIQPPSLQADTSGRCLWALQGPVGTEGPVAHCGDEYNTPWHGPFFLPRLTVPTPGLPFLGSPPPETTCTKALCYSLVLEEPKLRERCRLWGR